MNGPKASNAVQINDKLFRSYARKLESDNLETYTMFSERLAKWLADERAYYPESRPQILRLLKAAQTTLRRNVNADLDLKAPFHISSYIDHPMVAPYSTLVKAINPHKDRFTEPELHDEVKALLKTVTASVSPTRIDLASEYVEGSGNHLWKRMSDVSSTPNSPIEPAPGMQPSLSYIAHAFQSPSFLVQSPTIASAPSHSQSPNTAVQTNANSTAVVGTFTGVSCEASDLTARDACPGNAVKGDLSASTVLPTTVTSSAEDSQALHTPSVSPLVASSPAAPCSVPSLSSTSSEVISKVKKKKKAGFGLESLIQTDIEDLQKRGLFGANIKVEPTDVTISTLPHKQVSRINQDVIVLNDDEPADSPSEIAPPPSSYTVQSVQVKQTSILETTTDGAMTVDHVLPRNSERTTSHMNGDSRIDMAVDQAPLQLNGHHADYIDVEKMIEPSGTPPVIRDRNLPSHTTSSLVHGWPPSQGLDENENDSSMTSPTKSLNAAADLGKDTETEPKWNSPVPDATTKPKDYLSPENDIASRNVTPSSFSPTGFHPATNDTGNIPLVTAHPTINDSYSPKPPGSALLSPKTSNLQSLPNTLSSAPFVVLPSEHNFRPPALQSSTLPSSIAPDAIGNDSLLLASSEGETILVDITTSTMNGIMNEPSSSRHPSPSGPITGTTERGHPCDGPVPQPTPEQLRAFHAFGPDTKTLAVYKGGNQKRLRFRIRFPIIEEQHESITRWNNRTNPAEDLSTCTCASLTCYSRVSATYEEKGLDDISDLPVIWPTGGSLSMNVMYKGQPTVFPLSPPFKVGPNGMVDLSEYICLGENVIEFNQFDDISRHIFVLRLHRPTGAQLEQVAERRQKNKAWDDWLLKMAEPMVVRIPP